ncbi:MAG: hypothetical protein RIR00_131 [Pseudomonadota bacterium]|jgi:diguanylate cyclase (GGDEF)-like protein
MTTQPPATSFDTNQSRFPVLLGKLGKLTSIRDTEVLEQSLLKTLGPLLGVLDTALYRSDEAHALVRVIHHHRSKVIEPDGGERMVERIEQITNPQDTPKTVTSLTENIRLLSKPCARKLSNNELLIGYPLMGGDEVCGYFIFKRDREVYPGEDTIIRGVLEVFSNYYALLDISQRDRLTGFLNRQALENSFDRLWTLLAHPDNQFGDRPEGRRHGPGNHYWLAVIDIDHFKKVNDNHGHLLGDEILLLVSRLMAATFRSTDLLYRYGGEEFVAIIAADDVAAARLVFERVRQTIEAHSFPRVDKLTISIGFSQADPNILPLEVLGRADRCLYQAKNDGRNRCYEYQELVAQGVFQDLGYGDAELF